MQQVFSLPMTQELGPEVPGTNVSILPITDMDVQLLLFIRLVEALVKHKHKGPSRVDVFCKLVFEECPDVKSNNISRFVLATGE